MARLIYFLFGVLEVLLVFRLIFKLAGASYGSVFVNFIYSLTGIFILPFAGIFRSATTEGIETTAVLEPATLVAILVYAALAWGIVALVGILSRERE
ncbi:MAG TPA: YggT family protein [Patescibacteria group bacterium]|nr:YggT family protein [Patescibacteria group bacterium]